MDRGSLDEGKNGSKTLVKDCPDNRPVNECLLCKLCLHGASDWYLHVTALVGLDVTKEVEKPVDFLVH
jgi:hypothetical protein